MQEAAETVDREVAMCRVENTFSCLSCYLTSRLFPLEINQHDVYLLLFINILMRQSDKLEKELTE